MSDRAPRPGEGNGQQYELPDQYGPPRARRRAPLDAGGSVVVKPTGPTAVLEHEVEPERTIAGAEFVAVSRPTRTRSPWIWRSIAIVLVIVMIPVGISYVSALQAPGTDSLGIRTVEWVRDHGGNGIVNTIERWWYTNNPPPEGGTPDEIAIKGTTGDVGTPVIPSYVGVPGISSTPSLVQHLPPPTANRVPTPAAVVEQNEGVWTATGRTVGGYPAIYTTYVRPNSVNTSFYTGLMWLDTKLLRASYVVGLNEPGGGPNPWNSQIPASLRTMSIAAFNSGFKMDSARGGAWIDGQEIKPLVANAASFVIKKDGSAGVGVWGRDYVMGPDIQAVRQNLELLVDNRVVNPAAREEDTTVFGATLGQQGAGVAFGRRGRRQRRPHLRRWPCAVGAVTRQDPAGRGCGAGDGARHQHRLGERVHLRARRRRQPVVGHHRREAARRHVARRLTATSRRVNATSSPSSPTPRSSTPRGARSRRGAKGDPERTRRTPRDSEP